MLTKIKIYGRLRKFCNNEKSFEASIKKPLDAISFLKCNFKGIEKHMSEQFYTIQCGAKVITEDLINFSTQDDIRIIPVVHGNFFQILLGLGGLLGGGTIGTIFGSGFISTIITSTLTSIGTSMLIDGVTSLLSPQQGNLSPTGQSSQDPAALASNYSFTGLTNVSNAGVPVNLVYGEILVGSIVVSNGVDTVQVEGTN